MFGDRRRRVHQLILEGGGLHVDTAPLRPPLGSDGFTLLTSQEPRGRAMESRDMNNSY